MTDQEPIRTKGIVLHTGRLYDVFCGPFARMTDGPILDLAQVAVGDRLLDIGTGPGYLALAGARRVGPGGLALGIDPSPEMIERARKRAASRRSAAEYQLAAAEALPFGAGIFDVVVSRLVFHHLVGDLQARALEEIARVLRPGGRLVIADMSLQSAKHGHHRGARGTGDDPENKIPLEQAIDDAGFTRVASIRLMWGWLTAVAATNPES